MTWVSPFAARASASFARARDRNSVAAYATLSLSSIEARYRLTSSFVCMCVTCGMTTSFRRTDGPLGMGPEGGRHPEVWNAAPHAGVRCARVQADGVASVARTKTGTRAQDLAGGRFVGCKSCRDRRRIGRVVERSPFPGQRLRSAPSPLGEDEGNGKQPDAAEIQRSARRAGRMPKPPVEKLAQGRRIESPRGWLPGNGVEVFRVLYDCPA